MEILRDVRYALRMLRKSPGFTIVAVLTLALGIGVNTATFSMVNALLLHPYNFRDLDRLVHVWEDRGADPGWDARQIAPADAADLRASALVFEGLTTYRCSDFNLAAEGNVQSAVGCSISANFFDVIGTSPMLGRSFTAAEEQPGADQVAIFSYGAWQRRFGSDPGLVGKTIQVNGRGYTVVGIMPPQFVYPAATELWMPLALQPAVKADRAQLSLNALARLKPGVTINQARAELAGLSRSMAEDYPKTNSGRRATLLELRKELYMFTVPLFVLLQAAALFVLVLACANLANLLFARMIGRQKEIAVRTALGADHRRLAQLFVSETIVLSLIAGAAAIAVSFWSVSVLRTSISPDWTKWVPGWDGIRVDSAVLGIAILIAIFVGIAFGVAVLLHSGRVQLNKTLKESAGSIARAHGRLRSSLVVTQLVFALVLLVCAAVAIQGFMRLARVYQGFEPANVLRVEINLPEKAYSDGSKVASFYQQVLRGAAAIPGAQASALVTNLPASNVNNQTTLFTIDGRAPLSANESPSADLQISSPDYFPALRIPLVAGRLLSDADDAAAARVAVITRSMAERFWPAGNAFGQRIKFGAPDSQEPWMTIVGIVGDVRQNWWNPAATPTIYQPFLQAPRRAMTFVLRTAADPQGYATAVRDVVRQIDAQVALTGVTTLESEVTDSIAIIRILGSLMALFGCVALALASLGVYGVLSESVAERRHEIGIRMALGAPRGAVMKIILGQALKLTGIGLAIALPLSFAATRAMASALFAIVNASFSMLGGLAALLLAVALLAGYFPARRAMKVDPIVALRYE